MYYPLFFVFFVASARGLNLWDALVGGFSSLIGGFTLSYKPTGLSAGHEDAFLSISQLAEKNGYPLETHSVVTQDGYILVMHRIPRGRNVTRNGRVVFLMHGIWESSDGWLLLGPDKALAYILADQGYDVWMGNARGNRHTLLHTKFTSDMPQFWEFSWEEIGLYDLPAMIDYTLNFTGERKLFYVGFSQGTTAYFVMNSMRPEYNKKIRLMFALAPEAYLGNARHFLLNMFSPAHSYVQNLMWSSNIYSPSTEFFNKVTPFFCALMMRCDNLFISLVGPNNVDKSFWPVILGHVPTGSSTLQFIHYGQLATSKRFCRFDFGREKNIERYGQEWPPDYKLEAVTSPVILFYSGDDWLSDRRDVELLKKRLPKVVSSYYVKKFTHVDYMYADEASTLIYSNIVNQMNGRIVKEANYIPLPELLLNKLE